MKHLYLIRHAKSSWDNPGLTDAERPLNKRGKRDAPFMGKLLKEQGIMPDLICASPAKRAKQTAKIIAESIGFPTQDIRLLDDIYTSDLNLLLQVVQQIEDTVANLFLVGHNYVLTDLAESLTSEVLGNIPTCGIVSIAFNVASWSEVTGGRGEMLFFDYPKKHLRHEEP
ncbi:SixA phosphatase family protein [Desulfopila aestuarii]|uniref:Phosphohistidine phosphatase n=1 Tax=Desulfopila aestuarii DSM 18488 TaxID=1121416 RepID=A0A1M7YD23_9BACT|nr:histidine phosphatase family protein [Desulfopila aestuarii]SHO50534.1 phosphohistidine phosphatase [Desulfopila aestuarii DSM 18488]